MTKLLTNKLKKTAGFKFDLPNAGKNTDKADEEKESPPGRASMMPITGSLEDVILKNDKNAI